MVAMGDRALVAGFDGDAQRYAKLAVINLEHFHNLVAQDRLRRTEYVGKPFV